MRRARMASTGASPSWDCSSSADRNGTTSSGRGSGRATVPFKDANPACKPEQRYKALAVGNIGLLAFQSRDGVHWSLVQNEPVITKGAFDSQNLAFWDSTRRRYVEFHRGFRDNVRDIMTSTAEDFTHWTDAVYLEYPGSPKEHLYTNQIAPYYRLPHIFFGFPSGSCQAEKRWIVREQRRGLGRPVYD